MEYLYTLYTAVIIFAVTGFGFRSIKRRRALSTMLAWHIITLALVIFSLFHPWLELVLLIICIDTLAVLYGVHHAWRTVFIMALYAVLFAVKIQPEQALLYSVLAWYIILLPLDFEHVMIKKSL